MSDKRYVLAIDQGTSSTKTIVFDEQGQAVFKATEPLKTYYIEGNWVEQIPDDIFNNVLQSVDKCIKGFKELKGNIRNIKACGISNQRETMIIWDKTGKPLHNAIVWQCKRSVQICERLKSEGLEGFIKEKTGLIIDPYFSGTKVMWLYENNEKVKKTIDAGEAFFGTVDTWLLYKLTKGKCYMTDKTNASRTLFFNLEKQEWDLDILQKLQLSKLNLPEIKSSDYHYGTTDFNGITEFQVDIKALIGDSHAAAFGEGLYKPGTAKATLGTGCSVLMNIGGKMKPSKNGMVSTVCWSMENRTDYALEGIIVSCGATIEWLKKEIGLFAENSEIDKMNAVLKNNNGVYLIPAFSGLGAPHWQMERKASIIGLTFDCNKNHIVRAALESIAYQIKDVITAMEHDSDIKLIELQVDGGITSNSFVLQFLSDLLNKRVVNIGIADVSALGAALLAGLKADVYSNLDHLSSLQANKKVFTPGKNHQDYEKYYAEWQNALKG